MALMDHFSLVETLDLDRRKLQSTLETIEQGYNACVYHNRLHAADVMHGVFCLLLEAVCVRAPPERASSLHACACIRVLWPRASFWLPAINQPTPDPSAKEKPLPFAPIALMLQPCASCPAMLPTPCASSQVGMRVLLEAGYLAFHVARTSP